VNIRGVSSPAPGVQVAGDRADTAPARAAPAAGPAGAAAAPAVSLHDSPVAATLPAADATDLLLLGQLKARLDAGQYQVDYDALARALAEDWWLGAASAVVQGGGRP